MEFDTLSITLTKQLSKEIKKENGIYFTPRSIVSSLVDFVLQHKPDAKTFLEPSCGSGQFIEYLLEKGKTVHGVEKNETIFNELKFKNVICADFLKHTFNQTFDVITGNPPYFVLPKKDVDKRFYKYFDGRPNIYILFIIKSLELLNENGILAFVLPSNFLNCVYYNELRKYVNTYTILDIQISNKKFLETYQEVCIFVLQKTKGSNEKYTVHFGDILLFKNPESVVKIKKLCENTTTIHNLGCTMSVGTVVWNQCKDDLTDDPNSTLLIYSSDFKNNVLDIQRYKEKSKKNYINKEGSTDKILLVNRGYGTGKYTLQWCLVENKTYLVENHCIVIQSENDAVFDSIIKSFENKKTKEFIDLVFSNNAINIQEFLHVLPVYSF